MSSRSSDILTIIRKDEFSGRLGEVLWLFKIMDIYIRVGKLGFFPKKVAHETMYEIISHIEFMKVCQSGTEVLYNYICEKYSEVLQQCKKF